MACRTRFRALAAAALALAAGCADRSPPNLLLVVLDTTRADRLGCYGNARADTPRLDALAASGVRFAEAYAQSSLTPVSAGSFLTGTWPFRAGIRSLFSVAEERLSEDVPSLFERLRAEGRRTAAFVSARPMGAHYGLDRGFDLYADDLEETARRHGLERFTDAPQRPADETVDVALEWLEEHGRRPFAVLLHLFDAHDPSFLPPREFLAERVSFELPRDLGRTADAGVQRALFAGDPAPPARYVELHDAEVAWMDRQLGRVLDALREAGALERTLVCVVADHGEGFGEHGFFTHGLLWQEQVRVPWILAGPGVPEGAVVEQTVRLVDLLPTVLELLHPGAHELLSDGVSLAPHLRGDVPADAGEVGPVYAEVRHAVGDHRGRPPAQHSLRVGRWKYVVEPLSGRERLFDLRDDPEELRDVFAPDHPVLPSLRAVLARWGATRGSAPDPELLSEDEREALRALGYLPPAQDG